MTIEEEIKEIKKKHNGSFKTLCTIYLKNGRFLKSKQMWSSVIITFALSLVIYFLIEPIKILEILNNTIVKILSILPNILGFTLTGYVLLLSFGSGEFMEEITEQNDEGYSFYQHFSSIFGWSIIIQSTTLFFAFIFSVFSDLKLACQYAKMINITVFAIMIFFSFYSLSLISRLVLNVFSFGQIIQFHYTSKKLIEQMNDDNQKLNSSIVIKRSKSKK